jgi:membrane protease YdiL (CAAX protease family)
MSLLTRTEGTDRTVIIPVRQYSASGALVVWAAAAIPMGLLAWVGAPALAGPHPTLGQSTWSLLVALTLGLIWQSVLVVALVAREQRALSWQVLRGALWLRRPTDHSGRRGGRLWWWLVPFVLAFGALQLVPFGLHGPADHDFGALLGSTAGQELLHGNWSLFAGVVVMLVFNTVLGEELLFRGFLLPRMRRSFGRADWIANGVLFGLYHLHQPWSIPSSVLAGLCFAYPTRRFRSAWMGIIVHSVQSLVLGAIIFTLVW